MTSTPLGGVNDKAVVGQLHVGLHVGELQQRALAEGIDDFHRRQHLALEAHAHGLDRAIAWRGTAMEKDLLPNQSGAPVRLVVPWKYGFKSGKSPGQNSFHRQNACDCLE